MVTIHEPGYRGADPSLLEQIRKKYLEEDRTQSITGTACVFSGEPVRMSVSLGDTVYEADGAVAEAARNRALSEEDIRGKLGKAGDTPFRFEELTVYTDGKSFLPVSALGENAASGCFGRGGSFGGACGESGRNPASFFVSDGKRC